jgi:hypothetical protein
MGGLKARRVYASRHGLAGWAHRCTRPVPSSPITTHPLSAPYWERLGDNSLQVPHTRSDSGTSVTIAAVTMLVAVLLALSAVLAAGNFGPRAQAVLNATTYARLMLLELVSCGGFVPSAAPFELAAGHRPGDHRPVGPLGSRASPPFPRTAAIAR